MGLVEQFRVGVGLLVLLSASAGAGECVDGLLRTNISTVLDHVMSSGEGCLLFSRYLADWRALYATARSRLCGICLVCHGEIEALWHPDPYLVCNGSGWVGRTCWEVHKG